LHQVSALTREVPQIALRQGRDEAALEQAVTQQISDPFRILDIRFAPRDRFDMLRVDDQHSETGFEQVVDRLPILARALHRDVGRPFRGHPIR
jgi:hypothetical protein